MSALHRCALLGAALSFAGVALAVMFMRGITKRYESDTELLSLAFFEHPLWFSRRRNWLEKAIFYGGHLGLVNLLSQRSLRKLKSCRDVDRALVLAKFSLTQRTMAAAATVLMTTGLLLGLPQFLVAIAARIALHTIG